MSLLVEQDNRARLKQWLESGEARLQPLTFPQRELWETSPVAATPATEVDVESLSNEDIDLLLGAVPDSEPDAVTSARRA